MIHRALLGLVVTVAMVSGSAAQNSKSAIDEVIGFAGNAQRAYTVDLRAEFAQVLERYCQEVLNSLPTNTPSEDAWVTAEGKNINGSKLQRLLNSKEYSRSALKTIYTECKDTAALLIQIQQLPNKTEIDTRLEASKFIELALDFNTFLETHVSKVELSKSAKSELDDLHLHVIRTGLLRAALEALRDLHQ